MNTQVHTQEPASFVDLATLAAILWARRWWIAACVVLFTLVSAAAAFIITPVYRATTVMVAVDIEKNGMGMLGSALGQFGGLASLAGLNLGSGNAAAEESLAVLRSREFTEAFIRDNNLMPQLFEKRWDKDKQQWKGDPEKYPTLAQACKYFDKKVRRLSQDKKSGLITMNIDWRDRATAAAWANELVSRLNAEMRARAIATTNSSVTYLQNELAGTNMVEARQSIGRLMEAQINRRMFANVTEEYALRVVDRALEPDRKEDIVRPKKAMIIAIGACLGLLLGASAALVFKRA
ncbi:Wzz/FepE/Etk N-terminal domain-containing protein [Peristeroidobacter soli]|uniref:Wzz/FepE/Etk N-terminal domain-containing protein n=1 Tax=Peristeroidobacter soli TaxID=2497877 RepID=UPI00101D9CC7|nr:Wzz/FepE/Etk N-terminal domain-containing protein [Peristeroidobacter soli]